MFAAYGTWSSKGQPVWITKTMPEQTVHLTAIAAKTTGVALNPYVPLAAVALGWILGLFGDTIRSRRSQSFEQRQVLRDLQRATYIELQDKLGELWNCIRLISKSLQSRTRWNREDLPEVTADQFADLMMRLRVLGSRVSDRAVRDEVSSYLDEIRASTWDASQPPSLESLFNKYQSLLVKLGDASVGLM
jgi:hypothetical protein